MSFLEDDVFFGPGSSKCKVSSSWSQLDMMHVYCDFDAGCCKKLSLAFESFRFHPVKHEDNHEPYILIGEHTFD